MPATTEVWETFVTIEVTNQYNSPRIKIFPLAQQKEDPSPRGCGSITSSYRHVVEGDQYRKVPKAAAGKAIEDLTIEFSISEYDYTPRLYEREASYPNAYFIDLPKARAMLKTLTAWDRQWAKAWKRFQATPSDVAKVALVVETLASFVGAKKIARVTRNGGSSRWDAQLWEIRAACGVEGYELIQKAVSDLKALHRPSQSAIERHRQEQLEQTA